MANNVTQTNTLELDFMYTNTTFSRTYKIGGISEAALPSIEQKIIDYNAAIPENDKNVFISDDYDDSDPENVKGKFNGIADARLVMVIETKIV